VVSKLNNFNIKKSKRILAMLRLQKPSQLWGLIILLFIAGLWVLGSKWREHPNQYNLTPESKWDRFSNYPVSFNKLPPYEYPFIPVLDQGIIARKSISNGMTLCNNFANSIKLNPDDQTGHTLRPSHDRTHILAFNNQGNVLASADGCKNWNNISQQTATYNSSFGISGHASNNVSHSVLSPDGRLLASVARDYTVRVWDEKSGKEQSVFIGHSGPVFHADWSPDGKFLASSARDGIRIWEPHTGRQIHHLNKHTKNVVKVDWSPDGLKLVSASEDNTIRVWDLQTGQSSNLIAGHFNVVTDISWNSLGTHFASVSWDGSLRIWDVDGNEAYKFQGRSGFRHAPEFISWSPDGSKIVSNNGADLLVIDTSTWNILYTLKGHTKPIRHAAWKKDGSQVASVSWDKTLRIWDMEDGHEMDLLEGPTTNLSYVAWSPDETKIASAAFSSFVHIWDLKTNKEVSEFKKRRYGDGRYVKWSADGTRVVVNDRVLNAETGEDEYSLTAPTSTATQLSWHPDGRKLASVHFQTAPRIWDTETGDVLHSYPQKYANQDPVSWSNGGDKLLLSGKPARVWQMEPQVKLQEFGKRLRDSHAVRDSHNSRIITINEKGLISVWDTSSGQKTSEFETGNFRKAELALSPDGKMIARTGGRKRHASIWDVDTGQRLFKLMDSKPNFKGPSDNGNSITWSPDGTKFAYTAKNGRTNLIIGIWDILRDEEYARLHGHGKSITDIAWSPNGQYIASGSRDKSAIVWDVQNKKIHLALDGHNAFVGAVKWNPESSKVATASADGVVRIWKIDSVNKVNSEPDQVFLGHSGIIGELAWSPDGKKLASSSWDNTIRIWDTVTEKSLIVMRSHYPEDNYKHSVVKGRSIKQSFTKEAKLHPVPEAVWVSDNQYLYRMGWKRSKTYFRIPSPSDHKIDDIHEFTDGKDTYIFALSNGQLYKLGPLILPSYAVELSSDQSSDPKNLQWQPIHDLHFDNEYAFVGMRGEGSKLWLITQSGQVWERSNVVTQKDTNWALKPASIYGQYTRLEISTSNTGQVSMSVLAASGGIPVFTHYPNIDNADSITVSKMNGMSWLWWIVSTLCFAGGFLLLFLKKVIVRKYAYSI